ncbi:hypothetical protein [Devosia sp. Root635]|uniref:hypothetical protein n=1 Tax=Devosia sp. Root635 TaxID=1736575 RepID=UPI0006F950A2|nr:hypothetical protein [Devosia sp. Root635]KRA48336.1 hypothetical protein ASD80_17510 [Devosia sp. Root635]
MKAILVAAGLSLLASAASAQEDLVIDQTRLYVTDPAACQALEKHGIDAFMDLNFLSLSFEGGIQSMEFHCNFYDIKSQANTPVLLVDAVCEIPSDLYPDMLAIAPHDAGAIRVSSSNDAMLAMIGGIEPNPESPYPGGTTIYHRCDNLSEIPVD